MKREALGVPTSFILFTIECHVPERGKIQHSLNMSNGDHRGDREDPKSGQFGNRFDELAKSNLK